MSKKTNNIVRYLKKLAAGKKKIKSFKGICPFCDREMTIYTDGYRKFLLIPQGRKQ